MTRRAFPSPLTVANLGLESFAESLLTTGQNVHHVNWQPISGGDERLAWQLAQTFADERVDRANQEALARYQSANPVLVDIV